VGGVCEPFIRRVKGFARNDFQDENRELMGQDDPPARFRSGEFLSEGSAQHRIGKARTHHPLH